MIGQLEAPYSKIKLPEKECPCNCVTRHPHGRNGVVDMDVIYGKLPGMEESKPLIYKCPICGFECWIDRLTRNTYGYEEDACMEIAGITHGCMLYRDNPPAGKRTRVRHRESITA